MLLVTAGVKMGLSQDISQHSHYSPHPKTTCGSCSLPTLHWIGCITIITIIQLYRWPWSMIASYLLHFMVISFITLPASQLRCAPCSDCSPWRRPFRSPWRVRLELTHRPRGQWPLRHGTSQRLGESNGLEIPDFYTKLPQGEAMRDFFWRRFWEVEKERVCPEEAENLYVGSISLLKDFRPSKSITTGRSETTSPSQEPGTPFVKGFKGIHLNTQNPPDFDIISNRSFSAEDDKHTTGAVAARASWYFMILKT